MAVYRDFFIERESTFAQFLNDKKSTGPSFFSSLRDFIFYFPSTAKSPHYGTMQPYVQLYFFYGWAVAVLFIYVTPKCKRSPCVRKVVLCHSKILIPIMISEDMAYYGESTHQLISNISQFVAVIEGDGSIADSRKAIVFTNDVHLPFLPPPPSPFISFLRFVV